MDFDKFDHIIYPIVVRFLDKCLILIDAPP